MWRDPVCRTAKTSVNWRFVLHRRLTKRMEYIEQICQRLLQEHPPTTIDIDQHEIKSGSSSPELPPLRRQKRSDTDNVDDQDAVPRQPEPAVQRRPQQGESSNRLKPVSKLNLPLKRQLRSSRVSNDTQMRIGDSPGDQDARSTKNAAGLQDNGIPKKGPGENGDQNGIENKNGSSEESQTASQMIPMEVEDPLPIPVVSLSGMMLDVIEEEANQEEADGDADEEYGEEEYEYERDEEVGDGSKMLFLPWNQSPAAQLEEYLDDLSACKDATHFDRIAFGSRGRLSPFSNAIAGRLQKDLELLASARIFIETAINSDESARDRRRGWRQIHKHDDGISSVMLSGGYGSPLAQVIAADEEWPTLDDDDWGTSVSESATPRRNKLFVSKRTTEPPPTSNERFW
ncbi:hypothetical protein PT974_04580 [Cladobotryum mycophilum]|uniref:Uncharacterized protein n=1 Tax=Cladobotryum mycophilum TaxID=491253 RepID=A0ABR0SW75_9HYPO